MPRLIDADKADRRIEQFLCGGCDDYHNCGNCLAHKALSFLRGEPTVDAEPIEPIEFEWCHDCKEYDQNAHCCHRWTKVIRNTVNDLKTQGYEIVRHGHWQQMWEDEDQIQARCSCCGMVFWIGKGRDGNYCPNCGAKMDEVEDG